MKKQLSQLRLADLELFISAAHLSSLGKAAKLHFLSQSSASAAILRVERAFGISLCKHERRLFQLTKAGKQLLPKAEKWLQDLGNNVAVNERAPIRIATTHAMARVFIPSILQFEMIELSLMRPDKAYGAVIRDEADLAIVLDNAPWEGVVASEIGKVGFQLYSKNKDDPVRPVLLPEDQIEVLTLMQRWRQVYDKPLLVKARIPSWSLIADCCVTASEVGFLPDFLAKKLGLHPVAWQPAPSNHRILLLYKNTESVFLDRIKRLFDFWYSVPNQL